jgi:hypothetical protein
LPDPQGVFVATAVAAQFWRTSRGLAGVLRTIRRLGNGSGVRLQRHRSKPRPAAPRKRLPSIALTPGFSPRSFTGLFCCGFPVLRTPSFAGISDRLAVRPQPSQAIFSEDEPSPADLDRSQVACTEHFMKAPAHSTNVTELDDREGKFALLGRAGWSNQPRWSRISRGTIIGLLHLDLSTLTRTRPDRRCGT